jgi:DNA-binding NarL/FixJ family response regulator
MHNALVLEDFADTRNWLCEVLRETFTDIEITEAATVNQAKACLAKQNFDLALIDINLPDGSGIDVISEIIANSPTTYCVVATIFDDDEHLFSALRAGAQGYLLKEQPKDQFKKNLSGLLHGEPPLSPSIARKILRHFQTSGQAHPIEDMPTKVLTSSAQQIPVDLSAREQEILTLVAKGYKRNEIAPMLGISPHTVATHLKTIYSKLNVSSRAEATMEALRMGLVQL